VPQDNWEGVNYSLALYQVS